MRRTFFHHLYKTLESNKNVWTLSGDLGYGGFDKIQSDFPERFINCGASEQAMIDIAVGLAMQNKIPFVYSITPFLLYRPFESLRNYLNHEKIPVKLVGSGRGKDYLHDGFSHWCTEEHYMMQGLPNIITYYPTKPEEIEGIMKDMTGNNLPCFLSLVRV